jgi:hypothetical protein
MLGDAVHATLPYLASGYDHAVQLIFFIIFLLIYYADNLRAGMSFEDGAVLGECLSRLPNQSGISKTSAEFLNAKQHALAVFQKCRKQRTKMVVERGNIQQYLYHLHDGPEQRERDLRMQMVPTPEGEALAWRDPGLAPKLLGYDHIADVRILFPLLWCPTKRNRLSAVGVRLWIVAWLSLDCSTLINIPAYQGPPSLAFGEIYTHACFCSSWARYSAAFYLID